MQIRENFPNPLLCGEYMVEYLKVWNGTILGSDRAEKLYSLVLLLIASIFRTHIWTINMYKNSPGEC